MNEATATAGAIEPSIDTGAAASTERAAIRTRGLDLWYGTFQALFDVDLDIADGIITALIGPSGCGKTTLLRSVDRINERLGYVRIEGSIEVHGKNVYDSDVELVQLRKQVGMVFQRPTRCRSPYAGASGAIPTAGDGAR